MIAIINTKLVTPDNKVVYIPNGTVSSAAVTNYSEKAVRRVEHTITVPYEADFEKAKALLEQVLSEEPLVLSEPKTTVRVSGGSSSGCEIVCRAWVRSENYWTAYYNILENAKHKLAENGIGCPGEQLEVRIAQ